MPVARTIKDLATWATRRQLIALTATLVLTASLASCGGGGSGSASDSSTIGSAGGTVQAANGASVVVPPGAMTSDVTIRIANDSTGSPPLPAGLATSGSMVAITPHGTEFAQPVEVRVPVPNVTLQPNQELTLAKAQPGGEWELLSGVTLDGGVLVASVSSFSYFVPVVVTYPVNLVTVPALEVTTSLACQGQDCNGAIGPVSYTYTIQTNNGQAPTDCANPALRAVLSNYAYGNSSSDITLGMYPLTGGVVTAVVQPPGNFDTRRHLRATLRCGAYYRDYGSTGKSIRWSSGNNYPSLGILRAPAQVDVVTGLPAAIEVILWGGASSQPSTTGSAIPPTPTNRAVIDWQRSDDQGASWRNVAQSYEDEANPAPAGSRPNWRVWSVRHSLVAGAGDQGALIRARACYTPPDVEPAPCVTSTPTRITVLQQSALPQITDAPRLVLIRTGQTASFSATAGGDPAPTLQWQTRAANATGAWADVSNGTGATTGNFTTPVLSLTDNGTQFRVVASNALGNAESGAVTVSVSDLDVAPTITTQPASLNVSAGNDAAFAIAARGTEALSYQWQFNGTPITGANSPVLRLPAVAAGSAGNYRVVVSNGAGSATSNDATLSVSAGTPAAVAPAIVTQPVSVLVNAGNTATFAVGVSGTGPISYQWLHNGTPISGATAAYYSITSTASGDAGSYTVQVSNSAGNVTSAGASLTVNPSTAPTAVAVVTQPSPQIQAPGGSATFAVAVTGSGPITYQWLKNSTPIGGATSGVLTLGNVATGDAAAYSVTITNSLGSVTSNAATLTVLGVPAIASQPAAATAVEGSTATFSVSATGANLRYQWTRNNVAIGGAESANYTTPTLALSDNGAVYGVVVYNGAGVVFSSGAVLTVTAAPAGGLALVANSNANTLSIFRAQGGTGVLSPLGTTGTGTYPYAVAITPNGLYAYVTNLAGNSVSSYSVDVTAGTVTMTGSSVSSTNPYGIAMDPLGRFVWVANYSAHTVSAYTINGSTGQLTAAGAPVATSTYPYAVAAHPTGNYVYVANETGNNVTAYSVNTGTGALTQLGGTIANSVLSPHGIAVDPTGRFVYATSNAGGNIAAYSINASTGVLSVVGYANTGPSPSGVAVHPNGQFVYVANQGGAGSVSVFAINNSTGALTAVGSAVAAGTAAYALAVNTAGTYLYVANLSGNSTSAYSINSTTGALTSLGAATATGSGPMGIALTP